MRMIATAVLVAIFFSLAGCASQPGKGSNEVGPRPCPILANSELSSASCRQAAADIGFQYAIMAALAYEDKGKTRLPLPDGIERVEPDEDAAKISAPGFQYAMFTRSQVGKSSELIIAYRGTDERWNDWIIKNVFGSTKQNKAAIALFDVVSSKHDKVSVTGDSLGGALATQVSICRKLHMRVALNTSPRFIRRICKGTPGLDSNENNLFLFDETGQALGITMLINKSDQLFTPVNCIRGRDAFAQHNINSIAVCLALEASMSSPSATQYIRKHCDVIGTIVEENGIGGPRLEQFDSICQNRG
jgi:hypothetical protein